MDKVFVITNAELGWDCVRGVYKDERKAYESCLPEDRDLSNLTLQELKNEVRDTMNIVHTETLQ